jgi:hypothetical protein
VTMRTAWTQFRTIKKYRYFNILLAGRKNRANKKVSFDGRR